jgi:hypothetical protein
MGKNSKANKDKSLYARYKDINNPKDPNTAELLLRQIRLPEGKTFKEFISTSTYNPYRYNEDQISNNE